MFRIWSCSLSMVSDQVFSLENMCDRVFLSQCTFVFQANAVGYYLGGVKDLVNQDRIEVVLF